MRTKEQIEQLKTIPITEYLSQQGLQPVKTNGAELVYYSPKNEEHTPSFFVNPQKNVFHDFSGLGEQGDIIRLIQYITGCSFMQAIDVLEALKPEGNQSFSFSGQNSAPTNQQTTAEIITIQPLRNRALINYVASRKISYAIASIYLKEVYYRIKQKQYYAVGFGNEKGGFELRSQHFQGGTSPKWFTYLSAQSTVTINLFEGVFDFLSCCQLFNTQRLKNPTIVLNSLSFINNALPILSEYAMVNAFLDNDKSGKIALERLKKEGLNVRDCSHYYPNSKDFNEHLMNNYIT
ncbi:hypothetical protein GO755_04610 [Spirosoma sp. HMF4905]|uniref:Zinc finger CHC2-type domain-containing protein n=1 Tax=Spirosoma arboris TaxID=2682092 RepID=A0A7K1S686_9BACT|nr:toprim domain-containing protein [Spirosoma arboris]MVM29304.1 hypothetical protein [Spirosoma arboris]